MTSDFQKVPAGVRLPQKYRGKQEFESWFIEGARDGVAGRTFAYDQEAAFTRQHGQTALTAYAEGYNEGRAARNTDR